MLIVACVAIFGAPKWNLRKVHRHKYFINGSNRALGLSQHREVGYDFDRSASRQDRTQVHVFKRLMNFNWLKEETLDDAH